MENEVMKGTTRECFTHLLASETPQEALERFKAAFPAIKTTAARTWFFPPKGRQILPESMNMIALQTFLEKEGYVLTELLRIPATTREIRALLAMGRISVDELASRLKYSRKSHMFEMLFGKANASPARFKIMEDTVAELKKAGAETPARAPASSQLFPEQGPAVEQTKRLIVAHILSLAPLVDLALSNAFTAEDREEIRNATGKDGVFNLKNQLSRLCGERARTTLKS